MLTVQQQIINLAEVLDKKSQLADIYQSKENLAYKQKRITDIEEPSLQQNFNRLQNERQELQDKLVEVLNLATQKAKVNKVKHDLKIETKS